jgi:hypothetical protein
MSPRSDVTSLFVIEIVIVGEHLDVVIGSLITPVNTNLDVVIVQSHEGESTLGSFTEEEAKWVEVRTSAHTWMSAIRRFGDVLGEGIDSDLFSEHRVLCIYHRSADEKLDFVDDPVPSLTVESLCCII